jgi:hypothetical protein
MSFKDFVKKTSGIAKPGLPEMGTSKPAATAPEDKGHSGPSNTAAPKT